LLLKPAVAAAPLLCISVTIYVGPLEVWTVCTNFIAYVITVTVHLTLVDA